MKHLILLGIQGVSCSSSISIERFLFVYIVKQKISRIFKKKIALIIKIKSNFVGGQFQLTFIGFKQTDRQERSKVYV